jgi:ubiquinone/menaquinone biosynthesis C-methylase UbiE
VTLDDVTYAAFEIDPATFYATKFADAGDPPFRPADLPPSYRRAIGFHKFIAITDEIQRCDGHQAKGYRILDIGCGSGRFGAWVRACIQDCELHGLDMSQACLEQASQNGYSKLACADFVQSAFPYPDETFDFVYSMDVFGHIEFRHKDRVISEIARITKPGGRGFHGIEAGWVDYLGCDPKNPDDPIRKYVYLDGHVAVEDVDAIHARFSRHLTVTAAYNWLIPPVMPVESALQHDQWGAQFSRDTAPHNTFDARVLTDCVLGVVNARHLDALTQNFGPVLTRERISAQTRPGPMRDYILALTAGCGFAMVATAKRDPGR